MTTRGIKRTYIDTNECNITKALIEAEELSIPKSSGKNINNTILEEQTEGIQTTYIAGHLELV